jgi:hypothetical protein
LAGACIAPAPDAACACVIIGQSAGHGLQGSAARAGGPPIMNMAAARKATIWASLCMAGKIRRNVAGDKAALGPRVRRWTLEHHAFCK